MLVRRRTVAGFGLLVAASVLIGVPSTIATARFTPYAPTPLPNRAAGDFDGDGRPDVARIQPGDGFTQISVVLSGSMADVRLGGAVAILIGDDVDHDGDLDLVAATASGEVSIWLNDGHGRFTRQAPSRTPELGSEPVVRPSDANPPLAAGLTTPVVVPRARATNAVVVENIRPPTRAIAFDPTTRLPNTLRAPPQPLV